jgi:transcriptional regulator
VYTPAKYKEMRPEVMHRLIAAHPLGAVLTHGPAGLDANHIPFEIAAPAEGAPLGVLRAHVARASPLWRQDGQAALVLFGGPSVYVSPSCREGDPPDGPDVPTWDYTVVHAHGTLRSIDDPAWVRALLERLTARHESARALPWTMADAPADAIERMLKAIVGIEIVVERFEGKWKTRPEDRSR